MRAPRSARLAAVRIRSSGSRCRTAGPSRSRGTKRRGTPAIPRTGTTSCSTSSRTSSTCSTASIDGMPPLADARTRCTLDRRLHAPSTRRSSSGENDPILRDYAGGRPGRVLRGRHRSVLRPCPSSSKTRKPDLYDVLRDFYRQDPAARIRSSDARAPAGAHRRAGDVDRRAQDAAAELGIVVVRRRSSTYSLRPSKHTLVDERGRRVEPPVELAVRSEAADAAADEREPERAVLVDAPCRRGGRAPTRRCRAACRA